MSISRSWKRIEDWHQANTRPHKLGLRFGATPQTIARFESAIGAKLPDDFRESLLLHNGGGWILWFGELHTIDAMLKHWTILREGQIDGEFAPFGSDAWHTHSINGPIKPYRWSPRRLFVTFFPVTYLALDLDPPADGTYGQVIEHSHELGPQKVLAPSWSEYLQQIAGDLEAGKFTYNPDKDIVCPPGMFENAMDVDTDKP